MSRQSTRTRLLVLGIALLAVIFAIGIVQAEGGPGCSIIMQPPTDALEVSLDSPQDEGSETTLGDPRIKHPPEDALKVDSDNPHCEGSESASIVPVGIELDLEPIPGPEEK